MLTNGLSNAYKLIFRVRFSLHAKLEMALV